MQFSRTWAFWGVLAVCLGYSQAGAAETGLHCANPEIKLGDLRAGIPLARDFDLVNRGRQAVDITDVRPSCGCLSHKLNRRHLEPGDFATLRLEINTLTQPAGPQIWRIRLAYLEGRQAGDLDLVLSGRVVTEVTVEPAAIAVYASAALSTRVTLYDKRPRPLTVTRASTTSSHVLVRLDEAHRDEAGQTTQVIHLDIAADFPEGLHDETLSLITADPEYRELRVPFKVIKQSRSRVTFAPATVEVTAEANQPIPSRLVLLRGSGDEEVAVEKIEADHPAVRCTWARGSNSVATIRVAFDANRLGPDGCQTAVRVSLAGKNPETLTIPVTCKIRK